MLSKAEIQAAQQKATAFLTEVTAYKVLLKSRNLPLSLATVKMLDAYCGLANMILSLPPTPNTSP